MKANIIKLFLIMSVIITISAPQSGFAHSGGGGGCSGGDGGGGDVADVLGSGGAWGVSWTPNPNGSDVVGSSIWRGRPENVKQGPYQADTAVEDAEAELLSGYQSGTYTAEEVKTNLEWAQRVGIKISAQAQQALNNILKPPSTPSTSSTTKSTTQSSSSKLNDKTMDNIVIGLDVLTEYNKIKAEKKKLGLKTTKSDLAVAGIKTAIKDALPSSWQQSVDDAFSFLGY